MLLLLLLFVKELQFNSHNFLINAIHPKNGTADKLEVAADGYSQFVVVPTMAHSGENNIVYEKLWMQMLKRKTFHLINPHPWNTCEFLFVIMSAVWSVSRLDG